MKSILYISCLTILVNTFGCDLKQDVPPVTSKNGKWPVVDIEESIFVYQDQSFHFSGHVYEKGEKTIEFNEKDAVYTEFDHGAVTRSGPYYEAGSPKKFVAILGNDSVWLEIRHLGHSNLFLKTKEITASDSTIRMIATERR